MINILYDKVEGFDPMTIKGAMKLVKEKHPDLYLYLNSIKDKENIHAYLEKDKFFFCKEPINEFLLIYELIGMYYAKAIGLDTVEYILRKLNYKNNPNSFSRMFLMSENFWNPDYLSINQVINTNTKTRTWYFKKEMILNLVDLSSIKNTMLIKDLMKMTGIDIVMGQTDRNAGNCYLTYVDRKIRLGKLLDYELSYCSDLISNPNEKPQYSNPFLTVDLSERGIDKLIKVFPYSYDVFKLLLKIEMESILQKIEQNYPITIEKDTREILISHDISNKEIIKRVL